ncbi:MAG: three-Cys-motif partner protein TcmP [Anaerolineae bacterium]|nr:three-Cys-motif partner protein TcmP [Anaerolineae bacterium]
MTTPDNFLLPEADGLTTRKSQDYVHYKLKALTVYLQRANTALRDKPWIERYYLDLEAGPGKLHVGTEIFLGSPLIALASPFPATRFIFNEKNAENRNALEQRVSISPLKERVTIYQADLNELVSNICDEIRERDRQAKLEQKWSTFNIAFLDPEGLELKWSTVAQLAQITRMDLIINFSMNGIVRNIGSGNLQIIDEYFGTTAWRDIDKYPDDKVKRRRTFIDYYRQRLIEFGYHIVIDPDLGGDDIAVNNSKNAQVYSMIFASKHELGDKFWKQAAKDAKPPRLPGF